MSSRNRLFFLPFLFLIVGLIIFYPALNLPSISGLFQPAPKAIKKVSSIKVWANQRSGLYYCPESKLYGTIKPGAYMSQDVAIQNGYQPVSHEACR